MTDTTQGSDQSAAAQSAAASASGATQQTQQTQQTNGAAATVAAGAETKVQETKPYWPEDWRTKVAEYVSAGNPKKMQQELTRLESLSDPVAAYARFRDMENLWASKNFIRGLPKEGTPTEQEIRDFHMALGVPEKAEDYFKDLKLSNGAVLGDADKPLATSFATDLHKAGATPAVVNAAMNWYFQNQEQAAAALDESDDSFRVEAERSLKEEFGPAFKRRTNAISGLFAMAPGGVDASNEGSLFARLMGGRMADGKIIGNDPDMVRFLVGLANEINPGATLVEDGDQSGQSVDQEIAAIEKRMREDRIAYFKDEAAQARYRELITARDKIRARAR